MQRAHRQAEPRGGLVGVRELAAAVQAQGADAARQIALVGQAHQHALAELRAQPGSDRVRVGTGHTQHGGVEVPLHHAGVELDRAAEQAFVGRCVRGPRVRQQQPARRHRRFQHAAPELQDRRPEELGRQRQHGAEVVHVARLEDRGVAFDAEALLEHRAGEPHMLDAEQGRVAEGPAADERVAVDAEVAQPLARAGAQTNIGHRTQPQHVAEDRQLLRLRHARLRVVELPRLQPRALQQRLGDDALLGHLGEERGQAEHAVGRAGVGFGLPGDDDAVRVHGPVDVMRLADFHPPPGAIQPRRGATLPAP